MIKKVFGIILLLFFISIQFSYSNSNNCRVLILAFENNGEVKFNYLGNLIQNTLFAFFKDLSNYSSVLPYDLEKYVRINKYMSGDFQNRETLLKIANHFKAKLIIKGNYNRKKNLLFFNFKVIDVNDEKIIYRYSNFGESGIYCLDTMDKVAISMVEDFTGIKLAVGGIVLIK